MPVTKPVEKPEWASADVGNGPLGALNVQTPPDGKKTNGWDWGQKPEREFFNWAQRLYYLWINWFEQEIDAIKVRLGLIDEATNKASNHFRNRW